MEINLKVEGLSHIERVLASKEINKAVSRSLNRTARFVFTEGSRKIRQHYNIKAGDIKKALVVDKREVGKVSIKKASMHNPKAVIEIYGSPIPFKYFGARQTKKGVTVKIKKGGRRTLILHAFLGGNIAIRVKRGRRGKWSYKIVHLSKWGGGHVFIRKGPKRIMTKGRNKGKLKQPLVKLATSAVTLPLLFEKYWPDIAKQVPERFKREFWSSYRWLLSK